jgi:peptide/nickel transport system substrate-binding protein
LTRARRTGTAVAVLVTVALAGAACSTSKSPSGPTTPPARGVNQIKPVPYGQVPQGGTLNYPIGGKIQNFNPAQTDGNNLDTFDIVNALLPTDFLTDAANNFRYNPDYLTGEPVVGKTADGHQTVTYELNPKAKWSDGTAISADDYIAYWKANNGSNTAYKYVTTVGYDDITGVVAGAKGPQEVVVTFDKNYSDWKGLFSPLIPASTSNDPVVYNTGWVDKPLTSAGPFKWGSSDPTAQTYTIVPNELWWGRKPKLDAIKYIAIDPDAEPAALQNGEIDFIDIGPDAAKYAKVKTFPGVDLRVAGGPNFRHTTINGTSAILQDKNVRQALAMGIDRNAIAATLLAPLGLTGDGLTELNNHVYMKNQEGYQDNAGTVGKYDLAAAGAKLDAEGWKLGPNGIRVNDGTVDATKSFKGKPLTINFVIPTGVQTSAQESKLIQEQLKKLGVDVKINQVDISTFFSKYVTPGLFDFTDFSWIGSSFPVSGANGIYASPKGDDVGQNFSRISDPKVDELFKAALADLDPAQQIKDANAADALVWDDVFSLTLYQRPDLWGVKSNLVNFGAFGFASVDFTAIGFTK